VSFPIISESSESDWDGEENSFLKGYSIDYDDIPEDSPAGIIKNEIEKSIKSLDQIAKNLLYEAGKIY